MAVESRSPSQIERRLGVYLAGRLARRDEFQTYAEELVSAGFTVTSRWLDLPEAPLERGAAEADAGQAGLLDVEDIAAADVFVAFTEPPSAPQGRGGRHVEFGIALAQNKRLLVVGPPEHVFHYLPAIETFGSWADARIALGVDGVPVAVAA